VCRLLGSEEASERVQRCQSCIASGNTIMTLDLKVGQELPYSFGRDIAEIEILDAFFAAGRDKAQEQNYGITITMYRVQAHAS
jgi:hypothetical protein